MGALYICEPCTHCDYQPKTLFRYGTGVLGIFVGIGTCHRCHEIITVFPSRDNIPQQEAHAVGIESAHRYLAHVQKVSARHAAQFPQGIPLDTCLTCGNPDVWHYHIWSETFRNHEFIWLPCPRCVSGKLRLAIQGAWD